VNVTSKLCGVAAANEILITDAVRECVSPSLRVTERPDLIPVKRVDGELRVWTVTT
jgi:class 3 adenylate cyclase